MSSGPATSVTAPVAPATAPVAPPPVGPSVARAASVIAARATAPVAPAPASAPVAPATASTAPVAPATASTAPVAPATASTAPVAPATAPTASVPTTVKPHVGRTAAVLAARAVKKPRAENNAGSVRSTESNNSNTGSVSSTVANIGQEKPHLRTVDLPNANVNNSSTLAESERNEENRNLENFEPDDPMAGQEPKANTPITPKADPTMFLLLRVGSDATSEYIELRKQPIASMGSFNTHSIGSVKEFENLYGIRTTEGYKAMQRAFGVSKYGKNAPFMDYIHVKKCKFLGFDLVKEGLKTRISTLGESVAMQNASINRTRNSHFLDWLKEQVKRMDTIQTECTPIVNTGATIGTSTGTTTGTSTGSTACPCLEELSLLRDLIYLIVTIEGSSRPEVKQQLDSISLSKILNIAVKPAEKKSIVLQAIQALQKVMQGPIAQGTLQPNELQPVLRTIWTALTKEKVTRDVTQEEILTRISALISQVREFEASKQNVLAISAELDDARKRLNALREILGKIDPNEVNPDTNSKPPNSEEVKQLRARIEELTAEVKALEAKEVVAANDLTKRQNAVKENLGLEEEKRLKARVTELETTVSTLRANRDKAIEDAKKVRETLTETEHELAVLSEKYEAESKENASKKDRISKELAAARANLEGLEGKISLAKEDDKSQREHIERARQTVERLKSELLKTDGPDSSKTKSLEEEIEKLKVILLKERESKPTVSTDVSHKDIDVLKEQVESLESTIKSAIEKNNSDTKERLNTLLGFLVINDDMRVRAMQYWEAGNDSQRSEIASELSGEVCEFFKYFSSLINLQLDKINNTSVSDNIKADIFAVFKSVPAFDSKLLRKELGAIFQEIFIHIGHIGAETVVTEFSLKGSYPELYKIIDTIGNLEESLTIPQDDLNKFLYDIAGGNGFLLQMVLNAKNKELNVKFLGTMANEDKGLFLILLGVKLIQLLKESLDEKYDDLTKRCSV